MNLVIVESPAKAKTIKKYLGKDFEVLASYGHVRDLIPKEGAVDTENGFAMDYELIERNEKHMRSITKLLKKSESLYLATDPDREGEAISWHIYDYLLEKGLLKDKEVHRVAFNQITKAAVQDAVANPRELSQDLINAQQARRALDYLVGFNLSPLLWKKIRRGLSAGRVQSPALRLIVERELEIEAFKPREYWTIEGDVEKSADKFVARLTHLAGEKLEQFTLNNETDSQAARKAVLDSAGGELTVEKVVRKQRKRNPAAPFTTSTLQQEASRKLGFTAQHTMRVAQQLYEGIDVGSGAVGLITYMRTDSVSLAPEAISELRHVIADRYGEESVPKSPRMYKTKAKNAQEAHEAIRPTSAMMVPTTIRSHLEKDQFRLYELIWKRAVASQMIHATMNQVVVDFDAGNEHKLRANGSTIANPGFLAVYEEGKDDAKKDDGDRLLPPMEEGDIIRLMELRADQHFTEPPPRYSEATIVRALEEFGIGRPSTYASIIQTLKNREYVTLEQKRFHPTDVGRVVNKFLTEYFTQYVDYDFTARLEDELDAVSRGEKEWVPLLEDFWRPFKERVDDTQKNVKRSDVTQEKIDEKCPKCNADLAIRLGRHGRFIGCTGYPECDYTRDMDGSTAEEPETVEGRECPKCSSPLLIKRGKYGKFIGCSGYPDCRHIESLDKPKDTGVLCPQCHTGNILQRKSRRGKVFFSCSTYPKCDYSVWNPPIAKVCPECRWPMLTVKTTKRKGMEEVCPQQNCNYIAPYDGPPLDEADKKDDKKPETA